MKFSTIFFAAVFFLSHLVSCEKSNLSHNSVKKATETKKNQGIVINSLNLSDDELGFGCITEYYRKGTHLKEKIFVQTSSKDDKSWDHYISINGKKEIFISENDATLSDDNEDEFSMNLENSRYKIQIKAKIGVTDINSDSAQASGTMTVTDKLNKENTSTIEFEGGTAC